MNGVQLIAAERTRQEADEHYTPEHDDAHQRGELIKAALVYADCAESQARGFAGHYTRTLYLTGHNPSLKWPFEPRAMKLSTKAIKNLVKAGALIAAEIDRLQRRTAKEGK